MGKHMAPLPPGLSPYYCVVGACAGVITCFQIADCARIAVPVLFGASWGIVQGACLGRVSRALA
jgi:hypothetical protein